MNTDITPRLNTSKTWTALPTEFTDKVKSIFASQFKTESTYGEFLVEGRIYPDEIIVRIGFLETGRLKQVNFEASMDRKKNPEDKTMDTLYSVIDALGGLMEEYFELDEEEELDIPVQWKAFDFEGETIYLQQSSVNSHLENEADRILGLVEKRLLQEEAASEDALSRAEIDTDLAMEVQKIIRAGKHPMQQTKPEPSEPEDSDLN